MFTGIIQNLGVVKKKTKKAGQVHFSFEFKSQKEKLAIKLGQSIAVNGVCLTVAKVSKRGFEADVIKETLAATTLGKLKVKDLVNLERSLRYGDEMGGHFVTGHVDGQGSIKALKKQAKNVTFEISFPEAIRPFIAQKGSIAVDGISLTIQKVKKDSFEVGIIPHTLKVTHLHQKKKGDKVNLEIDLVARYLHTLQDFMPSQANPALSLKGLVSQGF